MYVYCWKNIKLFLQGLEIGRKATLWYQEVVICILPVDE